MIKFEGYNKGINLGGWLSQCIYSKEHYDSFIHEEDIAFIAKSGFDHVRVPIDYELVQKDNGEFIEEGFKYIDNCLLWCKDNNIKMILDLHKTAGYSFDEYNDANFFTDEKLQQQFIDLWSEFSLRYGKYNDILCFELLNEIVDINVSEIWNNIAKKAITAIRKNAPLTYIIIGGAYNNSISTLHCLDKPYDDHIVYTFHFYEPTIFTHQTAQWVPNMSKDFHIKYPGKLNEYKKATVENGPQEWILSYQYSTTENIDIVFIENMIKSAVKVAKERNVPLYCGEYGVIDQVDLQSTLNWYTDLHSIFIKYNISRAVWTYKKMDFGITLEHYAKIYDKLIQQL